MKNLKLYLLPAVAMLCSSAVAKVPLQQARNSMSRFENKGVTWPMPTRRNVAVEGEIQTPQTRPAELNTPRVANAPRRSAAGSLGIYGYITNSNNWDFVPQWVELTADGYSVIWDDEDYWMQGEVKLDTGWVTDGKLCGYATQLQFGQYLTGYFYKEFDLTNGASTSVEMDIDKSNVMYVAAYSPELDMILGFGTTPDGTPCLLRALGANPTQVTVVRPIDETRLDEMLLAITWNSADQRFVGVTYADQLVSVTADGVFTSIMESTGVPQYNPYYTGLCYDGTERVYYWNTFDYNNSYIYKLSPDKESAELVCTMPETEIFATLYSPAKNVSPEAPGRPVVKNVDFAGGALQGTVTYVLPDKKSNGDKLEGELAWIATLDGNTVTLGAALPGNEIQVQYGVLTEGTHSFGCYAVADALEGPAVLVEKYIGNDTPCKPENVKLSATSLRWDAVTEGEHGGYVDSAAVTYIAVLDGEELARTSATEVSLSLDGDAAIRAYQATVTAEFDGKSSATATSNKFVYGSAMSLPIDMTPTEGEFLLMTTSDDDGDGYGWSYVNDRLDADYPCIDSDYGHNAAKDCDDWIWLPPVRFDDAAAYYTLRFEAKGRLIAMSPDEYFEVKIGTDCNAEAMTQTLVSKTQCHAGFTDYERYFRVPEAGTYYVGFHAVSKPMMFGVRVRNISVERSEVTQDSPVEAAKIVATPAEKGELKATVALTLPTLNVSGGTYAADTELTAKLECGGATFSVSGKPGESVSTEVVTKQGTNRIKITVWNGEMPGLPAETTVYTGIDIPNAPSEVRSYVSKDNFSMILDWDTPQGGEHNGYIDPEHIAYTIHAYNGMMGWMPIEYLGENVTHYEFKDDDTGDGLAYLRLGVSSQNSAGGSKYLTATAAIVGKPYDIPMTEDFDGPNGAVIGPWMNIGSNDCQWGFADLADISYDWGDLPGAAMVGMPKKAGISSALAFPKFSTLGYKSVDVKIRLWTGSGAPARMSVKGVTFGHEEGIEIKTLERGNGWQDVTLSLPETLCNQLWIQILLSCDFTSTNQLCVIDSFSATKGTGVSEVEAGNGYVIGGNGEITVCGYNGSALTVATLDGIRVLSHSDVGDTETVRLTPGVYIVTVAGTTTKVRVY